MGLMDKVKAQATQLAQKTQETARDSKAKFDQAQAKRGGDALLRSLGAVVYADRTGRGTADSAAEIDRLVTQISGHEAENGISLAPEAADQQSAGQPGATSAGQPGADGSAFPADPPTSAFPADPPVPASAFPRDPPASAPSEAFPPSAPTDFPPEAGSAQG
jgi:hypothetical protein